MSTPAMPAGWAVARLPDLIARCGRFVDGDWVESKDQHPDGAIRLTQLADVGDGVWRNRSFRFLTPEKARELRCTVLKRGDVLVARMPDPLGRSCIFPGDSKECVTVVDVCIVRPGHEGVSERWLSHFINTPQVRTAIYRLQSGSTRKRISRNNLGTVELLIPPTNEQHRIVSAIESYVTRLDDAVATLERVQRNLRRYRASVLKAAAEGRLVPTEAELARADGRSYEPASVLLARILSERRRRWEEAELAKMKARGKAPKDDRWKAKYVEPVAPDTSELPELPEGWCWASPGQFFSWSSGDFLPKKAQRGGTVPVIGGNGVNGFHDKALVLKPTIVVGRVGALCGNIHLTDGPVWITDNAIYAAEGGELSVLPYWRMVMSMQNLNANAGGTGQPYVNQKHLNDLAIPLAPEAEQLRIAQEVERLASLHERVYEDARRSAKRLARLRQSILRWAFEGRLVDQDPADEPASMVLDRIRAERSAADTNKPKRQARRKTRSRKS
jgi:type I restriction enzyme, S subunit